MVQTGTPLILYPVLAASSSTKPTRSNCPDIPMAVAVCTAAVPAPQIKSRQQMPAHLATALPTRPLQKRGCWPPTGKISGCRTPRLRGTPTHCMPNSQLDKAPLQGPKHGGERQRVHNTVALAVARNAACPCSGISPDKARTGYRRAQTRGRFRPYTHHCKPEGQCSVSNAVKKPATQQCQHHIQRQHHHSPDGSRPAQHPTLHHRTSPSLYTSNFKDWNGKLFLGGPVPEGTPTSAVSAHA